MPHLVLLLGKEQELCEELLRVKDKFRKRVFVYLYIDITFVRLFGIA